MFNEDDLDELASDPQAHDILRQTDNYFFTFKPRPDKPEIFDEQQGFIDAMDPGVSLHIGGNGAGTSEAAACKIARFLLCKQPPPRKDTPFWIIGPKYDLTIRTFWKEKLYGHGHIPESEIEFGRISWYSAKEALPSSVPLKPWPASKGGDHKKNWTIQFKSYLEGRSAMQAEAIGGFCFTEQFPYEILAEVLRGCREYNFPGGKFCEFTPVDPSLSIEIQSMIEDDSLPLGWNVYRANTRANMLDPNSTVGEEWFNEFFGMVSEESRETRMTGKFSTYEGLIFGGFNRSVHLVSDEDWPEEPPAVWHRRGIDWGASTEHPFVCLWGYRDAMGTWFIYDEYTSVSQTETWDKHCEEIHNRFPWPEASPYHGMTYGDPSRPDLFREFSSNGIAIARAKNNVYEGIECVRRHLMTNPKTGQPMIYINKDKCPHLARQMQTYRWKKSSGTGLNPQVAKPEPLKRDDDSVDALRYMLFTDQAYNGRAPGGFKTGRKIPTGVRFRRHRRR